MLRNDDNVDRLSATISAKVCSQGFPFAELRLAAYCADINRESLAGLLFGAKSLFGRASPLLCLTRPTLHGRIPAIGEFGARQRSVSCSDRCPG